jgi:hypothetical protein
MGCVLVAMSSAGCSSRPKPEQAPSYAVEASRSAMIPVTIHRTARGICLQVPGRKGVIAVEGVSGDGLRAILINHSDAGEMPLVVDGLNASIPGRWADMPPGAELVGVVTVRVSERDVRQVRSARENRYEGSDLEWILPLVP